MDNIEHFKKVRRAWQKMHGVKGGKRLRVVDMTGDGDPVRAMAGATRETFSMELKGKTRRPSRRRCALWGVS